jgi:hypothetical protein
MEETLTAILAELQKLTAYFERMEERAAQAERQRGQAEAEINRIADTLPPAYGSVVRSLMGGNRG